VLDSEYLGGLFSVSGPSGAVVSREVERRKLKVVVLSVLAGWGEFNREEGGAQRELSL